MIEISILPVDTVNKIVFFNNAQLSSLAFLYAKTKTKLDYSGQQDAQINVQYSDARYAMGPSQFTELSYGHFAAASSMFKEIITFANSIIDLAFNSGDFIFSNKPSPSAFSPHCLRVLVAF